MPRLRFSSTPRPASRLRKTTSPRRPSPPAASADDVRQMLLEIAFALHATRVVGRTSAGG
jgi:hypothetical protein